VQVENDVLNVFVAQASFERRHNAASPRQYGGANQVVRGRSSAGKEPAIENTVQVGRHFFQIKPFAAMAAAAVHFEKIIPARDGFRLAAFPVGTAG